MKNIRFLVLKFSINLNRRVSVMLPLSTLFKSSYYMRKLIFGHVRLAKIQIHQRICAGWSESSLDTFWIAKNTKFPPADNEDLSDYVDAHADLSLRLTHTSNGTFSHVAVDMYCVTV